MALLLDTMKMFSLERITSELLDTVERLKSFVSTSTPVQALLSVPIVKTIYDHWISLLVATILLYLIVEIVIGFYLEDRNRKDSVWFFAYSPPMSTDAFIRERGIHPEKIKAVTCPGYRYSYCFDNVPYSYPSIPTMVKKDPQQPNDKDVPDIQGFAFRITYKEWLRIKATEPGYNLNSDQNWNFVGLENLQGKEIKNRKPILINALSGGFSRGPESNKNSPTYGLKDKIAIETSQMGEKNNLGMRYKQFLNKHNVEYDPDKIVGTGLRVRFHLAHLTFGLLIGIPWRLAHEWTRNIWCNRYFGFTQGPWLLWKIMELYKGAVIETLYPIVRVLAGTSGFRMVTKTVKKL